LQSSYCPFTSSPFPLSLVSSLLFQLPQTHLTPSLYSPTTTSSYSIPITVYRLSFLPSVPLKAIAVCNPAVTSFFSSSTPTTLLIPDALSEKLKRPHAAGSARLRLTMGEIPPAQTGDSSAVRITRMKAKNLSSIRPQPGIAPALAPLQPPKKVVRPRLRLRLRLRLPSVQDESSVRPHPDLAPALVLPQPPKNIIRLRLRQPSVKDDVVHKPLLSPGSSASAAVTITPFRRAHKKVPNKLTTCDAKVANGVPDTQPQAVLPNPSKKRALIESSDEPMSKRVKKPSIKAQLNSESTASVKVTSTRITKTRIRRATKNSLSSKQAMDVNTGPIHPTSSAPSPLTGRASRKPQGQSGKNPTDLLLAKIIHHCRDYVPEFIHAIVQRHQPDAVNRPWITESSHTDKNKAERKRFYILDGNTWALKHVGTDREAAAVSEYPGIDAGNGVRVYCKWLSSQ